MKKTISLALAVCLLVLTFCLTSGAASAVWDTNVEPEITEEEPTNKKEPEVSNEETEEVSEENDTINE